MEWKTIVRITIGTFPGGYISFNSDNRFQPHVAGCEIEFDGAVQYAMIGKRYGFLAKLCSALYHAVHAALAI